MPAQFPIIFGIAAGGHRAVAETQTGLKCRA